MPVDHHAELRRLAPLIDAAVGEADRKRADLDAAEEKVRYLRGRREWALEHAV